MSTPTPEPTQRQMRTWLRQNGHPVGSRGFLPADLVQKYREAHGLPTNPFA